MSTFEVVNTKSGWSFGVYEASTPEEAIAAMMKDAGSDDEPSEDLVAIAVDGD